MHKMFKIIEYRALKKEKKYKTTNSDGCLTGPQINISDVIKTKIESNTSILHLRQQQVCIAPIGIEPAVTTPTQLLSTGMAAYNPSLRLPLET